MIERELGVHKKTKGGKITTNASVLITIRTTARSTFLAAYDADTDANRDTGARSIGDARANANASYESTQSGYLFPGCYERGSETLVLLGKKLDFGLELGKPGFLALSAF